MLEEIHFVSSSEVEREINISWFEFNVPENWNELQVQLLFLPL